MSSLNHSPFLSRLAAISVAATLVCTCWVGSATSANAVPSPPSNESTSSSVDSTREREYWLKDYGFEEVWKKSTGEGVTVAVIDTGVDGNHPDLKNNVLKGWDASESSQKNGWEGLGIEPEHGTLVASMIAGHGHQDDAVSDKPGQPGNSAGIIGVAPDAKILPISLEIGGTNADHKSIDQQIPEAVDYAVDHGADIINLSVGSDKTTWPQSWDQAFAHAEEAGVLVIASSGNRGSGITQVGAPATIPGVLTVGGVDAERHDSWSSSSQGISIAVTAPSENLIGAIPDNKYALWSGTSGAAPIVTGLAALIKSEYPHLTSHQIIQRIIESADDEGAAGRDPIYGFGIINPQKAISEDTPDETDANPLGSMKEWIAVHRKSNPEEAPQPTDSATPVHHQGEKIVEAKAPTPVRPAEDSGILPFIVLGGFAFWALIITAGTILRLSTLGKRSSMRKRQ